ncbi:AMP-binding protein [Streptomyces sp. NBC_00487]|uniref:AMP-binding protein n=1 Tax=unclassified Streptomyces TaxID=2593676 RepID=UPI002E16DA10|nr:MULTISPECIES: AMP-binding protein [unclassified Streptomyces]
MNGAKELHQLFERWARETPHRPAVVTRGARLTYGTLEVRANRLARHLLHRGLGPGDTVAVCLSRLPDLLVAVVGVLKAGGAFAVVDPRQPTGEIGRWLELAEANTVLTYEQFRPGVDDGTGRRVVCLDADADLVDAHSPEPPSAPCGPTAAVLFTAGTTGRARPVDAAHRRLRAAYESWAEVFGLRPSDVHLVTAPTDTAAFTYGWIRALCSGGTLVLPESEIGPTLWGQSFAEGVTVLDTDPLTARLLLDRSAPPAGLRLVAVGGERLFLDEQVRLQGRMAPGARLLQVYGTVEVVGCGTWFETDQWSGPVAEAGQVSLLGRPFPGCRAEVRKGQIWLTPPGDPADADALPTGDAGTMGEDGLLRFAGRLAHRVTVRGRTVDPHRAEAALATHPEIRETAITVVDDDRLVAYVVPGTPTAAPGAETVRTHLAGVVPDPEIPVSVVNMGALPRNRAGKVDRRLLPLPAQRGAYGGKGGKGGGAPGHPEAALRVTGCAMLVVVLPLAALLTDVFWPGSTDLTHVPAPWSWLFRGLYLAELLAFCAGLAFLFAGRPLMRDQGRSADLTTAAHLGIVWLLVSWWPQDNLYRLAAKDDWERQAALVYAFNVPLMIAAAVVAVFVTRRPEPAATE